MYYSTLNILICSHHSLDGYNRIFNISQYLNITISLSIFSITPAIQILFYFSTASQWLKYYIYDINGHISWHDYKFNSEITPLVLYEFSLHWSQWNLFIRKINWDIAVHFILKYAPFPCGFAMVKDCSQIKYLKNCQKCKLDHLSILHAMKYSNTQELYQTCICFFCNTNISWMTVELNEGKKPSG